MLQWMGGSRRKVNTARKSTYNRQKQYFEQKKRRQQTSSRKTFKDGQNKQIHCNEECRSLDILSLTNLTSAPQCSSSFNTGSQLNSQNEAWTQNKLPITSGFEDRQATPDYFGKVGDRLEQRTMQASLTDSIPDQYGVKNKQTRFPQNYISVLDLLNDDGYESKSKGKSTQESHVAFSVEGLGKIGMETPVHSPKQTTRMSFAEYSLPKASRWNDTSDISKKFNFTSDEDFGISLLDGRSELLGKSGITKKKLDDSTGTNSINSELMHCDSFSNAIGKYSTKKDVYNPSPYRKANIQNARFDMKDENFLDERDCDTAWNHQQLSIDRDFEDVCWQEQDGRVTKDVCRRSNISELCAPHFRHLKSEEDQKFMCFDWERYPLVNQPLNSESVTNPSVRCLPETKDAADNLVFLSDESCFFTEDFQVGHQRIIGSTSKSMNLEGVDFSHQGKPWRRSGRKYNMKSPMDKFVFENLDDVQERFSEETYKKFPSQWQLEQDNQSVDDDISTIACCLFEGPDLDSVPIPSRTSQTDTAYFNHGLFSTDNCAEMYKESALSSHKDSFQKVSKLNIPVGSEPSAEFHFEMHTVKKRAGPINLMKSPKIYPCKPKEEIPFSSCLNDYEKCKLAGISVGQDAENDDELGHLLTTCRQASQEAHDKSSIGENDSSSKSVASGSITNCTNPEEVNCEGPEASTSPKWGIPPHSVDIPTAKVETSTKQENVVSHELIDIDGRNPTPLQGKKGKENIKTKKQKVESKEGCAANSSHQVMLESYVLQLLCVQKVRDSSLREDDVKKK